MDARIALKNGTQLHFTNKEGGAVRYVVTREMARGGSCIVYDAWYETNAGDRKQVRVKECCPLGLPLRRTADGGLCAAAADAARFAEEKHRFCADFRLADSLFGTGGLADALVNTLDIYEAGGTVYAVSAFSPEKTLAVYRPQTLKECLELVRQTAAVLGRIHSAGYLYLDLKPENVLVAEGPVPRVQLFDFDSLVPLAALAPLRSGTQGQPAAPEEKMPAAPENKVPAASGGSSGPAVQAAAEPAVQKACACENTGAAPDAAAAEMRLAYTRGFAAVELQTGRKNRLGPHTDVYGVGALLFYLLFGRAPAAPDCDARADMDFSRLKYAQAAYPDRLWFALREFFARTLADFCFDRYADMEETAQKLAQLERDADPAARFVRSTRVMRPALLLGREEELARLSDWLARPDSGCMFVTGMGGIGKSALVREFICRNRQQFDFVLFLRYSASLQKTLADDLQAGISTVEKNDAETQAEYFCRKMRSFRALAEGKRCALVIDDFPGTPDEALPQVLNADWKVLFLSRSAPPVSGCEVLQLGPLARRADQQALFEACLGRKTPPQLQGSLDGILDKTGGHTLVLELIAKQIAASRLTLAQACTIVREHGFLAIAPEKVAYEKDSLICRETIGGVIAALFAEERLSRQQKTLLKVLSLFAERGVPEGVLQQMLALPAKDALRELARDGWLQADGGVLLLHPVLCEAVRRWDWSAAFCAAAARVLAFLCCRIDADELPAAPVPPVERTCSAGAAALPQTQHDAAAREDAQEADGLLPAEQTLSPAALLALAEDVLENSAREPALQTLPAYGVLLYRAAMKLPRHREDDVFVLYDRLQRLLTAADGTPARAGCPAAPECSRAGDGEMPARGFLRRGTAPAAPAGEADTACEPLPAAGSTARCPCAFPPCGTAELLKLADKAAFLYAERGSFAQARTVAAAAGQAAQRHKSAAVCALYEELTAALCDAELGGAYGSARENALQRELEKTLDSEIRHARRWRQPEGRQLLGKALLSKAAVLIRSAPQRTGEIRRLLAQAEKTVCAARPESGKRLFEIAMVRAWYCTKAAPDAKAAQTWMDRARALAPGAVPAPLDRIDELLVPCADILREWGRPAQSDALLQEGMQLCDAFPEVLPFVRKRRQLLCCRFDVWYEAGEPARCREMLQELDRTAALCAEPDIPPAVRAEVLQHSPEQI